MRTCALLVSLILGAGAGCISSEERYACHSHEDCAGLLGQHCGGHVLRPMDIGGLCPFSGDLDPFVDADHGVCVYGYCTPADTLECGKGICSADQHCVLSKDVDNMTMVLLCLDVPQPLNSGCSVVERPSGECGNDQACVRSLARRADDNGPREQLLCVPPENLY